MKIVRRVCSDRRRTPAVDRDPDDAPATPASIRFVILNALLTGLRRQLRRELELLRGDRRADVRIDMRCGDCAEYHDALRLRDHRLRACPRAERRRHAGPHTCRRHLKGANWAKGPNYPTGRYFTSVNCESIDVV